MAWYDLLTLYGTILIHMNVIIDTPDNKAVGSDWVTTSKNKKVSKKKLFHILSCRW